jgi:hypothetical protein
LWVVAREFLRDRGMRGARLMIIEWVRGVWWSAAGRSGAEVVSRRVGGRVGERAEGWGSRWRMLWMFWLPSLVCVVWG